MKISPLSKDLQEIILNKAGAQARKYYQTFLGTPHVFLATFSLLATNKETERYQGTYSLLKNILNEYNINGPVFEKTFLSSFPSGSAPEPGEKFNITADREFQNLVDILKRRAVKEVRSMEVEDLIFELFTDRAYTIFNIFTDIIGDSKKTDEMYDKILKAFKRVSVAEVKDLEELPELSNVNKWVQQHPQVVVNADENIKKIMMGLSGRSIRNVMLTGPAGCGKSTYVYEFAQRIVAGNVPDDFKDKLIYQLDAGALEAGTR